MVRPKGRLTFPEQYDEAFRVYAASKGLPGGPKGPAAIRRELEDTFKKQTVSERTIERWFKDIKNKDTTLDEPFQWHRLEDYGLPWDASSYLLNLWASCAEGRTWVSPTAREMYWCWRVHLAAPALFLGDVWGLAQRFVARERFAHSSGTSLYLADLEAHLAFMPWTHEDNRQRYLRAIEDKTISPIRADAVPREWDTLFTIELLKRSSSESEAHILIMPGLVAKMQREHPEMLPSQWHTEYKKSLQTIDYGEISLDDTFHKGVDS